jgi:hypothetical protein
VAFLLAISTVNKTDKDKIEKILGGIYENL